MSIKGCVTSLFFGVIGTASVAVAQSQNQVSEEVLPQEDFPQIVTLPSPDGIEWVAPGADSKRLKELLADFATGLAEVTREEDTVISVQTASHAIKIDALSGRVRITQKSELPSSENAQDSVVALSFEDIANRRWDIESFLSSDDCDNGIGEGCEAIATVTTPWGDRFSPCAENDYVCQYEWYLCTVSNICRVEVRPRFGDPGPWIDQINLDTLIDRIDPDELINQIDPDELINRIDPNDFIDRMDPERLIDRMNIEEIQVMPQ